MAKKVLFLASNQGLWAEELQAPWDAVRQAGHTAQLATPLGKTPLPMVISMMPDLVDPIQNYNVNPAEVVERTQAILDAGEWDGCLKIEDVKAADYDALCMVGGPGASLDLPGNPFVSALVLDFYKQGKLCAAICYAVGAFVWARDPDNGGRSVIYGRTVTAHPHAWDYDTEMSYDLHGATPDNPGTDLKTTGFVFPLQPIVEDAVGDSGRALTDPTTNRDQPLVHYDPPFLTALSVESAIAFGEQLVKLLA